MPSTSKGGIGLGGRVRGVGHETARCRIAPRCSPAGRGTTARGGRTRPPHGRRRRAHLQPRWPDASPSCCSEAACRGPGGCARPTAAPCGRRPRRRRRLRDARRTAREPRRNEPRMDPVPTRPAIPPDLPTPRVTGSQTSLKADGGRLRAAATPRRTVTTKRRRNQATVRGSVTPSTRPARRPMGPGLPLLGATRRSSAVSGRSRNRLAADAASCSRSDGTTASAWRGGLI